MKETTIFRTRHIFAIFLAFAFTTLLSACASHGVRGQAPFVQVNGLKLDAQTVSLDLGIRNVNSEPIYIQHIEFSIKLNDINLAVYDVTSQANVIANGTENLRFELSASPDGVALLNDLQGGKLANLEYKFDGVFLVTENAKMPVKRRGRIFPVPGRPGQFR